MPDDEGQFLDALYLGVRDGAEFDQALDLLCAMFDVASATLIDFDAARPDVSAQATVGLFSPEVARRYERDFAAIDPAPPAFMARPPGTAIPTYRLLPEETKRPGVFFSEFFRPLGLEECLGGTLATTNGRFAMVGLQRTPDRAAFDDEDIAKLERLMPHLSRALQLRRSFLALDRRGTALAEVCDRLAAGVIGLDEQGRTLFANAAARRLSAQNDGIALDRDGRVYAVDRAANQRLAELARDVVSGGAGGIVRVPRSSHGAPLVVMVAPLSRSEGLEAGRPRRHGTLFVVHDPARRPRLAAEHLAEMFNLPPGSAAMLAAMAGGEELKEYGERAGISMNTVRFHLKTAYARTGVRRQSELIRRITAALRDLTDHRDES
jgi:DNA-binding CsgD family transcriptional regulator